MKLYLLSIGINSYIDSTINKLALAENDAVDVFNTFSNIVKPSSFYGKLLIGENATLSEIKFHAGEWIPKNVTKEDSVIIFFAGHGAIELLPESADEKNILNYLIPFDAITSRLYSSAFSLKDDLAGLINRIPSENVTIILDCCFSGGSSFIGARGIDGFHLKMSKLVTGIDPTSRVVNNSGDIIDLGIGKILMLACGPDQVACESHELGNGIYTHFLIESIKNNTKNGAVSTALIHDKVSELVLNFTSGRQSPVLEGKLQNHKLISI